MQVLKVTCALKSVDKLVSLWIVRLHNYTLYTGIEKVEGQENLTLLIWGQ